MTTPTLTPTRQAVDRHHEDRRRLARVDELEAEAATLRARNAKLEKALDDARDLIRSDDRARVRIAALHDRLNREPSWATVIPIAVVRAHLGGGA